jgi:TRAP-type C4-dicarboxylate transport system permease small subunit
MKRTLEYLISILLLLMFLITFYQVVARVVLEVPSVWTEELARFTYVWMVFLGAALLVRDDGLIRVTVLTDRMAKRPAAILKLATDLAALPFIAIMTWGAWTNTRQNWNTYAPTIDWLSIGYVYLVIWISGVLMLGYLAINLYRTTRNVLSPDTGNPRSG